MENFEIESRYLELGSEYGAWAVCTEVMKGPSTVFSVGVGTDISWDLSMIQAFDVKIHAFDPTPVSADWVSQKQDLPNDFTFRPVGLSHKSGSIELSPPAQAGFASFFVSASGDSPGSTSKDTLFPSLISSSCLDT